MCQRKSARLEDRFQELTDPCRGKVTYPLINIVVIAVCAVISGADDFVAIAQFGRDRREWLAKWLDLSAGIPSHDRSNAILVAIKPGEFEKCLLSWITSLHASDRGSADCERWEDVADQATTRGAVRQRLRWSAPGRRPIISAWGRWWWMRRAMRLRRLPKLLEILQLSGSLVTIDQVGCQVHFARQIVEAGADDVLAVKRK